MCTKQYISKIIYNEIQDHQYSKERIIKTILLR